MKALSNNLKWKLENNGFHNFNLFLVEDFLSLKFTLFLWIYSSQCFKKICTFSWTFKWSGAGGKSLWINGFLEGEAKYLIEIAQICLIQLYFLRHMYFLPITVKDHWFKPGKKQNGIERCQIFGSHLLNFDSFQISKTAQKNLSKYNDDQN